MTIDWQRFAEVIHSAKTFLLTAHQRPDCDCLGSELAMREILLTLGKEVKIVNPQPTPPALFFLERNVNKDKKKKILGDVEHITNEDQRWIDNIDVFFVLDTSSWQQLAKAGDLLKASKAKKIVLDHHARGNDIGAERFIDPRAEATGVLVVKAAEVLGVPLTKKIAEPAFISIATDTGWFRFTSVSAETFRTTAKLIDAGVVPQDVYQDLYERESIGRIRLVGRSLAKVESFFDKQVLLTSILQDDLKAAGALPSDTEDIVNMLLRADKTKMAVLLSELKDGSFKISLRSRCAVDCSMLCSQLGGGGHMAAAGATIYKSYDETKEEILNAIENAMKELCSG